MNLRDLTEDQQGILALIEDGELTIEDVSDHLEQLTLDRNQKIESLLYVINKLESSEQAVKTEIERLKEKLTHSYNAVKRSKEWLLMNLQDGEKHEFDLFTVSRVKPRKIVSIVDQGQLPTEYIKVKTVESVDKVALGKALKIGDVDGAELVDGNPSLRIK